MVAKSTGTPCLKHDYGSTDVLVDLGVKHDAQPVQAHPLWSCLENHQRHLHKLHKLCIADTRSNLSQSLKH